MPKRYKPSERVPSNNENIVIKLKNDGLFYIGQYCKGYSYPWEAYDMHNHQEENLFKDDMIDWWLDPIEEE